MLCNRSQNNNYQYIINQSSLLKMLRLLFQINIILILFVNNVVSKSIVPGDKTNFISKQPDIYEISTSESINGNLIFNFKKFNIYHKEKVLFNDNKYCNSIARINGNSSSLINGVLQSSAKSFFLLNPNGIIFGPNSKLSVSGSFHAIASYVKNNDINKLISLNKQFNPKTLLNIDTIEKFGFIRPQNDIVLNGRLYNHNNSVTLIAKNVIAENSKINTSSITGQGSGSIAIISNNNIIADNLEINTSSITGQKSGNIALIALDNITFNGSGSQINNSVYIDENIHKYEKTGDIVLSAKNIAFLDGAGISSHSGLSGGNISINADETILFSGKDNIGINSSIHTTIVSNSNNVKNAGNISFKGKNILLYNYAELNTDTNGNGVAGNISLNCQILKIVNNSKISSQSYPFLNNFSQGNAGKIQLNANSIILKDNSQITTDALTAHGGQISINSNDLFGINSRITTSVRKGSGSGGNIYINNKVTVLNQADIIAGADKGDGGNIYIYSEHLFKSINSIFNAQSNEGNHGTIKVESLQMNVDNSLVKLSQSYLNTNRWSLDPCASRFETGISSFIIDPQDGFPLDPDDWQPSPLSTGDNINFINLEIFQQGKQFYQNGHMINAIKAWEQAAFLLNEESADYFFVMLLLSRAYQKTGKYLQAFHAMIKTVGFVKNNSSYFTSLFLNQLGDLILCFGDIDFSEYKTYCLLSGKNNDQYLLKTFKSFDELLKIMGNKEKYIAEDYFKSALIEAKKQKDPFLIAICNNNLGNAYAVNKYYFEAIDHYEQCLKICTNLQQSEFILNIISKAYINKLRAIIENQDYDIFEIKKLITNTINTISSMPTGHEKVFNYISLSIILNKISSQIQEFDSKIHLLLSNAYQISKDIKDIRMESYACAKLGKYYGKIRDFNKAISLTRKAIFLASQKKYLELLYMWQHQMGKLLLAKDDKDIKKAIQAYKRAIKILHPSFLTKNDEWYNIQTELKEIATPGIFQSFYSGIRNRNNLFVSKIKPLYLELSEIILYEVNLQNGVSSKKKLVELRNIIEIMKTKELSDYFQDECFLVFQKQFEKLTKLPEHTALLYTIPSKHSLTLLLTLPNDMVLASSIIEYNSLKRNIDKFIHHINKKSNRYPYYAQKLYQILIDPIETDLVKNEIHTIIIAPDDVLRLIPFSALKKNNTFLIEKYSLAIIPAISLTDTKIFDKNNMNIILGGLSKGKPPLPFVKKEICELKHIIDKNQVLLNDLFTEKQLNKHIQDKIFNVCLIATHAMICNNPRDSYLQTYSGSHEKPYYKKTTFKTFEKILNNRISIGAPLDIVFFSACETAYGDERAALGLAGMSIKAGVRSSIATLWSIRDKAAPFIVTEFFNQLKMNKHNDNFSKAMALRNAQQKMIKHKIYHHPKFWSPFILVGNWR